MTSAAIYNEDFKPNIEFGRSLGPPTNGIFHMTEIPSKRRRLEPGWGPILGDIRRTSLKW
jgi:hypothetical protein